ncbi:MAG TPA: hypothetical protein VKH63_05190 [Candidatus Acidoferrum sp.]|nr:hypothetical protein [Candidatus Acidoferrum sp.]
MISITATCNYQQYLSTQPELNEKKWGACAVYSVFKKLENDEFVHVASREDLEQALQLVEALNAHWPAEYVVRDSAGNAVDLTE